MCIRDSPLEKKLHEHTQTQTQTDTDTDPPPGPPEPPPGPPEPLPGPPGRALVSLQAVSYTHLTLPTILRV